MAALGFVPAQPGGGAGASLTQEEDEGGGSREDRGAYLEVAILGIEEHERGVAPQTGRLVEIAQGAQPLPIAQALDPGEQLSDELIEHVEGIVLRRRLEDMGERHQGGDPTVRWHPGNRRRPGHRGITGQGSEPAGRHGLASWWSRGPARADQGRASVLDLAVLYS